MNDSRYHPPLCLLPSLGSRLAASRQLSTCVYLSLHNPLATRTRCHCATEYVIAASCTFHPQSASKSPVSTPDGSWLNCATIVKLVAYGLSAVYNIPDASSKVVSSFERPHSTKRSRSHRAFTGTETPPDGSCPRSDASKHWSNTRASPEKTPDISANVLQVQQERIVPK